MSHLALAYPNMSDEDFEAIQEIRKAHDPKYFHVVDPHITLVFATDKLGKQELTSHIKSRMFKFKPFKITFNETRVIEDDSKEFFHAFLIPSEGFDEINQLHDELYAGELISELRLDIPFVPHLGIGTSTNEEDMLKLTEELQKRELVISCTLNKITIAQYDGNVVLNLEDIPLE